MPVKKLLSSLLGAKEPVTSKRNDSNFRPKVEDLEGRAMMSVVGPELHVNTTTALNQSQVDVASRPVAGGGSVVVWTHQYNSSGSDTDIRAQRYDGAGNKVGGEISVAANIYQESQPSVAMDANGNFVVVWVDNVSNSGNTNIVAQRYFANGVANGPRIQVATDARREFDPSVAMDSAGNFVVSYTLAYSSTDLDVYAKRYSAGGALLGTQVVAGGTRNEHSSSVARTWDGRFAIAYQIDQAATGSDIMLRRYTAGGALVNTHAIANSTRNEFDPEAAMDWYGNTMVVYQYAYSNFDHDIYARRVSNTGIMGGAIGVDTGTNYEFNPAIAVDLSDGDFVVAYQQLTNTGTSLAGPNRLIVREMNANGTIKSTTNLGDRSTAALSINGSDVYFLGDVGYNVPGDAGLGIFARRGVII
jgi:hypothetical protein